VPARAASNCGYVADAVAAGDDASSPGAAPAFTSSRTIRSGSATRGGGRNSITFTTPYSTTLTPIPNASESTVVASNPGRRARERRAKRRSRIAGASRPWGRDPLAR